MSADDTRHIDARIDADWMDELNPQQRSAVTAGDGPVLVVAGAGTGKTKTLASRVAYLVANGVDPQRIMLLTFTRRAAAEMLRRANAIVRSLRGQRPAEEGEGAGVEGEDEEAHPGRLIPQASPGSQRASASVSRVWGGTFHSVANRLLRTYGKSIDLDPGFTVIDQADAEDLIHVVRHEMGLSEKRTRFPRKSTCLAIYSRTVNSSDPLEQTLKTFFPWCADWHDELKGLFKAYVDAKTARNVMDYDDLLLFWFHLLGDEELADRIEARFDHVLVDEYQDTNRLQAGILRRMRRHNRNIMVVGDDAQSIYSFRAAEVRNILDFPEQFPGAAVVTLEQNYRSRQPILDATNAVIGLARERFTKDLWSSRTGQQKPLLVTCGREEDQTDFVVSRILEHYEQGIPLMRQAVLFRTGHWSDHLEVELGRRNVPYHKFGGLKFLEAAHVKDLLAFLRVLENPRDQLAWNRVLHLLEGVGPATAARCFRHVADHGWEPRRVADFPAPPAARDQIAALGALLDELVSAGRKLPPAGQVERIRRFYDPIFQRVYDNPEPRRRDLEQLEHIATGYASRSKFLTDLTLDPPSSTGDLAGPPHLDEDWLTLSTIHSAKGCEWDVVFVIHAADGIMPSDLATGDAAQIEEERRLLYVACTRARDWLYVTFPLRYYYKMHRLGDAHGYAQLTRFIPPAVHPLFEPRTFPADAESDDAAAPGQSKTTATDIRKSVRSMWE
ncbi:MAG: ATP-dependent DNA helicase PcrA [Phycisphaerae bacterium]|nr:ATP-dependent DNA helicase PcrA [Phycisphaerae bacterium]